MPAKQPRKKQPSKSQPSTSSLAKNGAGTLLGAAFVLAFGHMAALAELQVDQTLESAGPWIIGYNSSLKGCVASATADDRTTVWIGFEGSEPDTPAYLAFTNPNWRSLEPRKFYDLEIQAQGSYRWRGYGSAVERPNEKGLFVFGVKQRVLQDLAQTSALLLSVNKELLARTNVAGLPDAIEKLMYCQEHRLAALKNGGTKAVKPGAQPPKQQDRSLPEPASAPTQMLAPEETVAVRLDGEKNAAVHESGAEARTQGEAARQLEPNEPKLPDTNQAEKSAPQLAVLPVPAGQAAEPELKGDALVRAIKQELKRVGCYSGLIDNDWQAAPARASVQKFAQRAGVAISLAEPSNALLDVIKVKTERMCPPEPAVYPTRRNIRHATRNCPGGFDEDGDCISRRRTSRHDIDDDDRRLRRNHDSRRRSRDWD